MKIISIGTDRKLFEDESAVLMRLRQYASRTEEFHIVVFSLASLNFSRKKFGNLFLYPTNSKSKWNYISDAFRIGKEIIETNNLKIDSVISVQDPFETGLVGVKLKKTFKLPLQIQIHTDFLSKHFRNSFLNFLRVSLVNFTIPKADRIRVVGEGIKKSLIKKLKIKENKIDILPVFIDIRKIMEERESFDLKKEFPQFKQIIFMASRLEKEKRVDVGLLAFKEVVKYFSNTGLVIAGSGSELDNLKKLVKKHKLDHKVIFVGWQENLISYYKTSDIFLFTSEYEGYGMTLIEAGASGTPIVTTKVGVADSSLFVDGQNSFVSSVGDYKSISESIVKLLGDPQKRELFKNRMQDSIRNTYLSREEYFDTYIDLLKKCLEK